MNYTKILRKSMNLKQVTFVLALGLLVCASGASAQEKLGEIVTEGGFDWMIGDWIATTDSGDKVELVWKWELDEHMLSVHLKWPNYEYRGMIYYIPAEEKVVQVGVDNKGGSGKGLWEANGSKAVNKYEHTDADGQVHKMGMVHSQTGSDAMKVEIYELSDTGQLGESPTFTTEYKRQKKQTPPKAQSKATEGAKSIAEQEAERMKIAEFQVVR
jgi:hypothetical protein